MCLSLAPIASCILLFKVLARVCNLAHYPAPVCDVQAGGFGATRGRLLFNPHPDQLLRQLLHSVQFFSGESQANVADIIPALQQCGAVTAGLPSLQ